MLRAGRLLALIKKEFCQIKRDSSTLLMGVVLPIILIIIMGYGMSLDVKNVPVAVVLADSSPSAREVVSFVNGSEYFSPSYTHSLAEARKMLERHEADAILVVPNDFSADFARGNGRLQLILNGVESITAMSAQRYIEGAVLSNVMTKNLASMEIAETGFGQITVESRIWFNDANTSTWFFVPGIMMMVLTLCGVFLTAVVMAREWERGTLEALFVTPAKLLEIVLAKLIPYFCVAFCGFCLCLGVGIFLYDLPVRGSLVIILLVSMLYIIVALGLGLTISAMTKNQFLACQVSLLISFLPSMMLSGFLFDLHSQPLAIRIISEIFPTTHYLQLLKSLLLTGNYWPLIMEKSMILLGYGLVFTGLAFKLTKRRAG